MNREEIIKLISDKNFNRSLVKAMIDDNCDLSNLDLHGIDFTDAIGERINFDDTRGLVSNNFKTLFYDVKGITNDNNDVINKAMHSCEDIYMMQLLSEIIKYAINHDYISVSNLYINKEIDVLNQLYNTSDQILKEKLDTFMHIKSNDIPKDYKINVKNRNLCPLVKGRRLPRN